jgi:hypothetical protein
MHGSDCAQALIIALLAVACTACEDRQTESKSADAQASCARHWKALNGSIEATEKDCSVFVATSASDAAALEYWSGRFELVKQPTSTSIDFQGSFSRPRSDDVYPVELITLGGHFGAAQGRYFFWESDAHWTGWLPTEVPFVQPLHLRVRQRGAKLEGYINGALVGTFTLNQAPSIAPVGVFFKGAKGVASKVSVANVTLSDIR